VQGTEKVWNDADVRKCRAHKNQPAREQQIERIQSLTAKTPRARREEEINKFTHRFLGVLRVIAVRIAVEPLRARDRDVLGRRGWERGDLASTGRVPLCGDERVSGICGAEGAARSLFDPDRPNSCAKKNQELTSTECNEIPWSKHAFVRLIGQNNINGRTTLAF
jgi:hypothetical protein